MELPTARLIIGNIIGLMCTIFCLLSTFCKTKKSMMKMQCIDCTCGIISCLILRGYSGALTQTINLIRNIIIYKEKMNKILQIICLAVIIIVGVIVNNKGALGLLPMIASVEYALIIMKTEDTNTIRLGLAFNNILWIIYDIVIQSYLNAIMGIFIVSASLFNTIKDSKQKKHKATT